MTIISTAKYHKDLDPNVLDALLSNQQVSIRLQSLANAVAMIGNLTADDVFQTVLLDAADEIRNIHKVVVNTHEHLQEAV